MQNIALAKKRKKQRFIYFILIFFVLFFLLPIYILIVTGFKSFQELNIATMWSFPKKISFVGITNAIQKMYPNVLNSFLLTLPATFFSALFGSINGYIFSKWKFKGSDILFIAILFGMFIPYQSILIPLVQFLSAIGLYGSRSGLILTHIVYGIPITTLIFRNYYTEIPDALLESGFMDGLTLIGIYIKIILPLSIPGFVVIFIWQFTSIWNEFLFAVTITQDPSTQPITVALQNLAGSQIVEWNTQMAGALLAAIPPLLLYIFLGKYFIRGLLAGSIKA